MKLRYFCAAVCLLLLFAALPLGALASESPSVTLIAASDFQALSPEKSAQNTKTLLQAIRADGHTAPVGLLFGGDYSQDYEDMSEEISLLAATVSGVFPDMERGRMLFLQGNHDPSDSQGLVASFAHDTPEYGVFAINEADYMTESTDPTRIEATARALEEYLAIKKEERYRKPIFVMAHAPLHYTSRTRTSGNGVYARLLFDVLNRYGENLNIFFLYGHNHGKYYDNYVGGSGVFLTRGDTVFLCPTGNRHGEPKAHALNFTYMNYGYVGYSYATGTPLTATVFDIRGERVTVSRYGSEGACLLKNPGAWDDTAGESAATYKTDDSYLALSYPSGTEVLAPPPAVTVTTVTATASGEKTNTQPEPTKPSGTQSATSTATVPLAASAALVLAVITVTLLALRKRGK